MPHQPAQQQVRNLAYLRSLSSKEFPELGAKLYEALTDIVGRQSNLEQQVNGNAQGQPAAPPAINALKVTAQNGHFSAAITDNGNVFRGIQYYIEHADNPQFTNPTVVHLGDSRNWDKFLGNTTRYFRAYSSYASSPPSAAAYHGGAAAPQAVAGGGSVGGPAFQASQGSGTGAPGQGLQGPGQAPFRSATGVPPVR